MRKLVAFVLVLFTLTLLMACGGVKVSFNSPPGGPVAGGFPAQNPGDPAEQDAIKVIQKYEGYVTQDNAQPNRPVSEVNVFRKVEKNAFSDADVKVLATLSKLRKIHLTGTSVTGATMNQLAGLANLTELDLAVSPDVNDAGLKEIATLKQLKVLNISGINKVTDPGLRELAPLTGLEELSIYGHDLGDSGIINIATRLPNLKKLIVNNNSFGDAGMPDVARMPKLEVLSAYGTRITDAGLNDLSKCTTLKDLELSFWPTDKSMDTIARMQNLERLWLSNTQVSDKGLEKLGALPKLKTLELRGNGRIDSAAIAKFVKDHPSVTIKQ